MITLLIALGALVVGKIHGQDTVASFVINTQVAKVSTNRRPTVFQEISVELQPPPKPQQPSFKHHESYRSEEFENNFDSPSTSTITEYEPTTRIIAVTKQPVKMEVSTNKTNKILRVNGTNNTVRNNARQKEDLAARISPPKQVQPIKPENEASKDNTVLPDKHTVVGPLPTTNVTFDERANFDGDQCPTGYVRVNGKCVEAD